MKITIAAALTSVLLVLSACGGADDAGSSATAEESGGEESSGTLTASDCGDMRREWNRVVVTDFDRAEEIRVEYQSRCTELCGGLVEDTDTPATETRPC
ncbi:MAG: hypothetical protein M5U19_14925 [Microthrixaceae bacterium]|nr:hypothetical protein [Microthrixaceae bacterium]